MPPLKKDEPGYAEYREQYALCNQSQLVDYPTVIYYNFSGFLGIYELSDDEDLLD
jgi:hypothetical protein